MVLVVTCGSQSPHCLLTHLSWPWALSRGNINSCSLPSKSCEFELCSTSLMNPGRWPHLLEARPTVIIDQSLSRGTPHSATTHQQSSWGIQQSPWKTNAETSVCSSGCAWDSQSGMRTLGSTMSDSVVNLFTLLCLQEVKICINNCFLLSPSKTCSPTSFQT